MDEETPVLPMTDSLRLNSNLSYRKIDDAETIRNIPIEFIVKEIGINSRVFILEIPIRVTPISSGKGEAIIKAPINGRVQ